jgi:hypothetical protein
VVAVGDPAVVIAQRSRDNQGSLGAGFVPGPHLLVEGVGVVGAGEPVVEALLAPAAAGAYGEADQGLGLGRCAIDASEYASDRLDGRLGIFHVADDGVDGLGGQ